MDLRPILLVEGSSDDVGLTMRGLHQCGIANEVVVARDGVEALDYLQGRGPFATRDVGLQPALVLLDLNLPRLGGLEVLRQMQADPVLRMVRTVVFTASSDEDDVFTSYSLGASGYVCKPTDFNEYLAAIRRLGDYWLHLNQPVPCEQMA